MELRDCQKKAIECFEKRIYKQEKETNISMCTGSGKSLIIRLLSCKQKRRIVVFPWLDLLQQFYDSHKDAYSDFKCVRYYATEGTLPDVQRLSSEMKELNEESYLLFTTYTSAPFIYSKITSEIRADIILNDEAHHINASQYKEAFNSVLQYVNHTVNLSATLPSYKEVHYKYSLLRGIKDKVVRDFHMELFLCVSKERNENTLLLQILSKLKSLHKEVKLLIYTAEANTEDNDSSSVKTFMNKYSMNLRDQGYWIEGIRAETKNRKKLLRDFEKHREVSILVSCKTLSEGIDLKNANCMLPWDPTSSQIDNIQRIGRCLRLLKDQHNNFKKEQPPSTILIPVFLQEEKYKDCGGEREAIHDLLSKEISEGERGNFRPIVNVCTALKEELADDDPDLFNRLLNWPAEPKVAVNKSLVECVAKQCKKSLEDIFEELTEALQGKVEEEELEELQEGEWSEEMNGKIAEALAESQGITLIVCDGDKADIFGKGESVLTLEKQSDDTYKMVKGKKQTGKDKELAKKRIAQRMNIYFSDDCKILLGLDSIEGADATEGMVLTRLTTEVHLDEDWEKRRLDFAEFYEKNGRCPIKEKRDNLQEKKLGSWQQTQRQNYKLGLLSNDRINKLNNTNGWKWERVNLWEKKRLIFETLFKKLGRSPSQGSKDKEERDCAIWVSQQRRNYKKNLKEQMTPERINKLNLTEGWKWEESDPWFEQYDNWIYQQKKLGHSPSKESKDEDEKKAGTWQSHQRKNYKSKKFITQEKIDILDQWAFQMDVLLKYVLNLEFIFVV